MTMYYSDIPKGKSIDDYPDDTEFIIDDRPPKYEKGTLKRVYPRDAGYDEALTKEEALNSIAD